MDGGYSWELSSGDRSSRGLSPFKERVAPPKILPGSSQATSCRPPAASFLDRHWLGPVAGRRAARASAGVNAPTNPGAPPPHLRARLAAAIGARGGWRGATGGAGPFRLPLPTTNLRRPAGLAAAALADPSGPPGEPSGGSRADALPADGVSVLRQSPGGHGGVLRLGLGAGPVQSAGGHRGCRAKAVPDAHRRQEVGHPYGRRSASTLQPGLRRAPPAARGSRPDRVEGKQRWLCWPLALFGGGGWSPGGARGSGEHRILLTSWDPARSGPERDKVEEDNVKHPFAVSACVAGLVVSLTGCGSGAKAGLPVYTGGSSPSTTATGRPATTPTTATTDGPVALVAHSTYT